MPEKEKALKTREDLLREFEAYKASGRDMPLVRDPELLRPGDMLDIVDPFGGPRVAKFFLMKIETRTDEPSGKENTIVIGVESEEVSYWGEDTNMEKVVEYSTLTGKSLRTMKDIADVAIAMGDEPITFSDPDMPIKEYDARTIGLKPVNETGEFTDHRATFLSAAAA